ncbi:hypothetical protein [Pedobacter gandavensis]|uniref:hypothetical protein n=1 Tax=Pedobacter gandavensis TaxID=2679963 RepID=UPI00292ED494|nr:hypothetical protein [Pedobacter gandavensis]
MKKQIISFDLKKSTLFVFKSKTNKSGLMPTTVTDPTNGTATSHTSSVVIYAAR